MPMPSCLPTSAKIYITGVNGKILNMFKLNPESKKLVDKIFNKEKNKV